MSGHVEPKVNNKFRQWMNRNYGKNGEVKFNRRRVRKYLGTTFDFTEKSDVKMKMDDYVEMNINNFPMKISNSDTALTPSGNNIQKKETPKGKKN